MSLTRFRGHQILGEDVFTRTEIETAVPGRVPAAMVELVRSGLADSGGNPHLAPNTA